MRSSQSEIYLVNHPETSVKAIETTTTIPILQQDLEDIISLHLTYLGFGFITFKKVSGQAGSVFRAKNRLENAVVY